MTNSYSIKSFFFRHHITSSHTLYHKSPFHCPSLISLFTHFVSPSIHPFFHLFFLLIVDYLISPFKTRFVSKIHLSNLLFRYNSCRALARCLRYQLSSSKSNCLWTVTHTFVYNKCYYNLSLSLVIFPRVLLCPPTSITNNKNKKAFMHTLFVTNNYGPYQRRVRLSLNWPHIVVSHSKLRLLWRISFFSFFFYSHLLYMYIVLFAHYR